VKRYHSHCQGPMEESIDETNSASIFSEDCTPQLSAILQETGLKFSPTAGKAKYVVHTSTQGLMGNFTQRSTTAEVFLKHACGGCCMHGAKGEPIARNCPCQSFQKPAICWYKVLTEVVPPHISFVKPEMTSEDFFICPDAISIFTGRYPAYIREAAKVSCWEDIETWSTMDQVLMGTYWYRNSAAVQRRVKNAQRSVQGDNLEARGVEQFKRFLKQSIFTVDGLLIKYQLAIPEAFTSYGTINAHASEILIDLIDEYCSCTTKKNLYAEMKEHCSQVKSTFHSSDLLTRTSFMGKAFVSVSLRAFFQNMYVTLNSVLLSQTDWDSDYTMTPAWIFRCSLLSQTRMMGYLPPNLSLEKLMAWIEKVSTPKSPELEPWMLSFLSERALSELKYGGVPRGLYSDIDESVLDFVDEEGLRKGALEDLDFQVFQTASLLHRVVDGGNMEDERLVVRHFVEEGKPLKIWSLETGDCTGSYTDFDPETLNARLVAFWYAFNLVRDYLIEKGALEGEKSGITLKRDLEKAVVLIIKEPGKDRKLLISEAMLNWFEAPGAKMIAGALSIHPDHYAGLKGKNHAWDYAKRLSPENGEAGFMYDSKMNIKSDVRQGFQDWTEATDDGDRRKQATIGTTVRSWIGFPRYYGRMYTAMGFVRQRCSVRIVVPEEGTRERVFISTEFFLENGVQMGRRRAKHTLHETQLVGDSIAHYALEKAGFTRGKPSGGDWSDPTKMDPTLKQRVSDTIQSTVEF